MRTARYLISGPLIVAGFLFALYGVFALTYAGDGSGPTYVKIGGSHIDAHLAGGVSLAVAAVLVASGVFTARRGRSASPNR